MSLAVFLTLLCAIMANTYSIFIMLKRKYQLWICIFPFVIWTVAFFFADEWINSIPVLGRISHNFYILIIVLVCFNGNFFQKTFAFLGTLNITRFTIYFGGLMAQLAYPYGSEQYGWLSAAISIPILLTYIFILARYGHRLADLIFGGNISNRIWSIYTTGVLLSFLLIRGTDSVYLRFSMPWLRVEHALSYVLQLAVAMLTFVLICVAIVVTQKRAAENYELKLARSALSAQREHYERITDMLDEIRMMRHDIQYQLSALCGLLSKEQYDEMKCLLTDVLKQWNAKTFTHYCENHVANALISYYVTRLEEEKIDFKTEIVLLPGDIAMEDYELCIVLGNLLENALAGCRTTPQGLKRYVSLNIRYQSGQLALEIRNSFDGIVRLDEKNQIISRKENGGLGVRSIRTICEKYHGEYLSSWQKNEFTSCVLVHLGSR